MRKAHEAHQAPNPAPNSAAYQNEGSMSQLVHDCNAALGWRTMTVVPVATARCRPPGMAPLCSNILKRH